MRNRVPILASERPPIPEFSPVPRKFRDDGWTPERQKAFIEALADCGSVRRAAAMVNTAQASCYALRRLASLMASANIGTIRRSFRRESRGGGGTRRRQRSPGVVRSPRPGVRPLRRNDADLSWFTTAKFRSYPRRRAVAGGFTDRRGAAACACPHGGLSVTEATAGTMSTGIGGLDNILAGGLARGRVYLLEGSPGTGKTTIATQFLRAGAAAGERTLYITLSETEDELRMSAASHGWDLAGIEIYELVPPENLLDEDQQQSLLYSSDLELGETTKRIFGAFERVQPDRVVIDSLSEIRLLAQSSLRYRRQILALKHYFAGRNATVLMLDDLTSESNDRTVHSVAHAVIMLEELARGYGAERRRLRVVKYRGRRFRGGFHDFTIETGGVEVYPRLISAEHHKPFSREAVPSESAELNALLGGGVERGSSVLILGPAGTGKSLLALTFVVAAGRRGERAAMFVFDEELGLLKERARGLGIDLDALIDDGRLVLEQVDAAEMTPGEFSERVRHCVESQGARTVVIDSLNGFQAAMPEENALILHMHELLQFLNRQGATTFLTVAQHGLVGDMKSPVDVTYLADTVVLLRYFEAIGRVRRAISVVKKRTGFHEDTIREYRIDKRGFTLGEPLMAFQGVLRGVPTLVDDSARLMAAHDG